MNQKIIGQLCQGFDIQCFFKVKYDRFDFGRNFDKICNKSLFIERDGPRNLDSI